ncbi:MFS transporter [Pseudomonas synxantha]|uniref:MFS transporter n=1 Tax=Pseudomonas synxantha TaxID=47883 RepID=A0ABS0UCW8_9PSED|nr:MFS transporter [Pseudomonas synxantha]MBI6563407.1 MFS transporter [Pseudomonas synxantha]MBI6584121.1 MFS transporter [Pseudomonas synxantha]MBI6641636.1 MFS transporter [Pseudomonas synxantha]
MTSTTGWSALLLGKNGLRSAALAGGVALHAINVYLVTTILPSVVADIGGLDYYAWNTTLFVVASIIGSVLSTKCLTALGARAAYVWAGVIFAIGSGVCSLAPDMAVMILGRTIQGLGGGLLFALPYAMIRLVFAEPLWPRAMALISGMWGAATLIGPAVGGVFAEYDAWRAAFWALIPVTALFMVLAWALLPKKSADTSRPVGVPWAQLVLLSAVVLAISVGSIKPEAIYSVLGLAVGFLLLYLVYRVEVRSTWRLMPKGGLAARGALLPLYVSMSLMVIGMTSEVFVPYFLQVLHLQTPLLAGYISALMAAGWTLGALYSSGLKSTTALRAIGIAPFFIVAGLVLAFVFVPRFDPSLLNVAGVCAGMLAVGAGIGLAWPHLLTRVLESVAEDEKELAGASITTVQLIATAIGAALAGMIVNLGGFSSPGGVAGASSAAAWLFGVYAALSLLIFVSVRPVIRSKAERAALDAA